MNDPQRILIVRLSALGDVVMASGLIPALRARFPGARLSWLCEPSCAPLLIHNPRLDHVVEWPRAHWEMLWREKRWWALSTAVREFRSTLRRERFDLVLDVQGLLKSGMCAWWTGAPRRIGVIPREGSRWLVHERLDPPSDDLIGSEYRFAAQYLGARADDFKLDLAVGQAPRERALRILREAGASGKIAALCAFTTRPQKHWPQAHWPVLARALRQGGYTPVLLGGPGDTQAAALMASPQSTIVNLAGRLALDESVAVIAASALVIGVDTGLTHMGTALNIATVALFGSTRPYLRTDTPTTTVLYDGLPCSPCRRNPTCNGRFDCMKQLTPERVLSAAQTLEARARP